MKNTAVILAIGRALQMILLFLNFRLLTEVLPKAEVGQYFFYLSLAGVTGLLLINPIGTYFNRSLHSLPSSKAIKRQSLVVLTLILLIALLNLPMVAALSLFFDTLSEHWVESVVVLTFFVIATSGNNTVVPVFNFFKHRVRFVILTVLSQGLALLLAYWQGLTHLNANSWLLGHAFGFFIVLLIALVFKIEPDTSDRGDRTPMKIFSGAAWQFAWPIAIVNISTWALTQGYRPFLEKFGGLEVLAEIGLGLGLASALAVAFEYLVQQIYQPDFYEKAHSDPETAWLNLAIKSLIHYISFCVFLLFVGKFVLPIVATGEYKNAGTYMSLGAFIEFLRMVTNLFSLKSHGELTTYKLRLPFLTSGLAFILGLGAIVIFDLPPGLSLVAVLGLSYVSLFFVLTKSLGVNTLRLYQGYNKYRSRLFFLLCLPALIPNTYVGDVGLSWTICVVMTLIFLWIQYKLVKYFETHGQLAV